MKYFWATRDREGFCLWSEEPIFSEDDNAFRASEYKKTNTYLFFDHPDFDFIFRENQFHAGTLKMNECKKVTIRLEEAE